MGQFVLLKLMRILIYIAVEVMVIQHTFKARGHWWFDSGLMGLYFIAKDKTTLEAERWQDVKVVLGFDGVSIEAPDDRMTPFLEACYEELASNWWNRSTKKQRENPELVCYDQEKKELDCLPKRMPTPIPALSVSATSWRGKADALEDLSALLQEEVAAYLKEHKKSLWGTKKKLCYEQPVCHPKLQFFPKAKRGGGAVCSVCGQTSVCDRVSQTSFPLFSSQTATFSFNSDLGSPDLICWECQLLGKFAVHASYYKVADSLTYIMQLNSGDLRALKDAHLTFGIPSPLRLLLEDDKIYFYNFGEKSRILQNARLSYEVLWGFYLAAYDLVLKNQQKRRNETRALEDLDEDEIDEESLRQTAALNVVLAALDSKGSTFITKEVVTYTDTTYLFRLIGFIKKYIRTEAPEAMAQDLGSFFELLFWDLELPNPQKPYDPLNGMDRNSLLRCVFEKKSIVCRVESFVFKKSLAVDYPSFGRILFFVMAYELVAHCRDSEEGEKRGMAKGMTKEQIALATKLGAQIVLAAKEALVKEGEGLESMKAVKGDLFALRKTRTATDFLEQLNRLQFRYGIVVNKEIAAGVFADLAEDDVPFEEFRAYCMIAALNAYNNVMRPRVSGDKDSQSGNE